MKPFWKSVPLALAALLAAASAASAAAAAAQPAPRSDFPSDPLFGWEDPLAGIMKEDSSPAPAPYLRYLPRWPFSDDDFWRVWPPEPARPDLRAEIERTRDEVVVSVSAPGSEKGSLDVKVVRGGVNATYRAVEERRLADGGLVRQVRAYEQFVGVPDDAAPGSARIERRGDEVRVAYARKRAER